MIEDVVMDACGGNRFITGVKKALMGRALVFLEVSTFSSCVHLSPLLVFLLSGFAVERIKIKVNNRDLVSVF